MARRARGFDAPYACVDCIEAAVSQPFAEGLATRTAFGLPQRMLRQHIDDFVLVSEEEMRKAVLLHLAGRVEAAHGPPHQLDRRAHAGASSRANSWRAVGVPAISTWR